MSVLVQTIVKIPHPLVWFQQFLCECNVICKLQYWVYETVKKIKQVEVLNWEGV